MIVFAVGEDGAGGVADGEVVCAGPAFLEGYDAGPRGGGGELDADLGEAGGAVGGEVEEAPAVESDHVELGWGGHCAGCGGG